MRTYSTRQVAKLLGVHRVTLQHWLTAGKVRPSQIIRMNGGKVYLWTLDDVEKLRRYKAKHYWEGRGGRGSRRKRGRK